MKDAVEELEGVREVLRGYRDSDLVSLAAWYARQVEDCIERERWRNTNKELPNNEQVCLVLWNGTVMRGVFMEEYRSFYIEGGELVYASYWRTMPEFVEPED